MAEALNDPRPPAGTPHRRRFTLALLALAGVLVAAVGGEALVVASRDKDASASASRTSWSAWRPIGTGTGALQEIANRVAPTYRATPKKPLVTVKAEPLIGPSDLPITLARGTKTGGLSVVRGDAVLFTLCGDGPDCTLPGKRSVARGLVLSREALELALYTFHYVDGVGAVVVALPPSKGKRTADRGLLFERKDVASELRRPLAATLPATVLQPDTIPVDVATQINRLTKSNIFGMRLVQTANAQVVMLLNPLG